jgi:hypothetical protein
MAIFGDYTSSFFRVITRNLRVLLVFFTGMAITLSGCDWFPAGASGTAPTDAKATANTRLETGGGNHYRVLQTG